MNKSDLVMKVAKDAGVTNEIAGRVIDAMVGAIVKTLKGKDYVRLVGFGTFKAISRSARNGRNPRTGAPLHIPARIQPVFVPSRRFKAFLNYRSPRLTDLLPQEIASARQPSPKRVAPQGDLF